MKWKIKTGSGTRVVALHGALDERGAAALEDIDDAIGDGPVTLDLAKVSHVNSYGVAAWVPFLRRRAAKGELKLRGLGMNFVGYCNILASASFGEFVDSVLVPFICSDCEHTFEQEHERAALIAMEGEPSFPCPSCKSISGADASIDELKVFCESLRRPQPGDKTV